jgi:hypothetical protein
VPHATLAISNPSGEQAYSRTSTKIRLCTTAFRPKFEWIGKDWTSEPQFLELFVTTPGYDVSRYGGSRSRLRLDQVSIDLQTTMQTWGTPHAMHVRRDRIYAGSLGQGCSTSRGRFQNAVWTDSRKCRNSGQTTGH